MNDAAATATASSREASAPRRRIWPWLLLGLIALVVAAAGTGAWLAANALQGLPEGFEVRVDGDRLLTLPTEHAAWVAALGVAVGVVVAALVVLVVVPLALLVALVATALALGAAVAVVLAVGAVALSPLWLVGLLAWLALRKPSRAAGEARAAQAAQAA